MTYRVDLEIYNGPLDLLLYLIRKEEVEIADIPIVRITEQYMAYLDLLTALDINIAAEFLVMAATLMEIKSRMILPRPEMPPDEAEDAEEDPRLELVRQLLEYKRFKEAAQDLESLVDDQMRRFGRPGAQIVMGPQEERFALDAMMKDVQIWDLLNAFARVMRSINIAPREVIYDDTPIEEIAEQILSLMSERRTALFSEVILALFAGCEQVGRSHLVGAFLAILECIRQRYLAIQQDREFADLRLFWRGEGASDDAAGRQPEKADVPQAHITSREAAREAEFFDHAQGRFKEELLEDVQATEFDEALEAIRVPEVETYTPIYSDDELMGRKDAAGAEAPSESGGEQAANDAPAGETPPSAESAETPDEVPPTADEQEPPPGGSSADSQ